MSKKRRAIQPDVELKQALALAAKTGVPRSHIVERAGVDQSTIWKWANERSSPTMSTRQAVLDAIAELVREAS